jgi:hypothetical protein
VSLVTVRDRRCPTKGGYVRACTVAAAVPASTVPASTVPVDTVPVDTVPGAAESWRAAASGPRQGWECAERGKRSKRSAISTA